MQAQFKILCVDDEPNILESFKRQLRGKYDLSIATSAASALEIIKSEKQFAVVVSDMRMPVMDGVEFLKAVQKNSPLTVRVMLTGNHDQETALQAVNEGQIFRFVNKPCSSETLEKTLNAATEHYALLTAEKSLLQNTLSGSIKVLSDILALSDPIAFGRASALREPVRAIAKKLKLANTWELDLATMLHPIGWVTVPETIKLKFRRGEVLNPEEKNMVARVPELGSQFIKSIPRLEGVARIILYAEKNFDGTGFPSESVKATAIPEGARIIRIANELENLAASGITGVAALKNLQTRINEFDPNLLAKLLGEAEGNASLSEVRSFAIQPNQLCPGQRLTENLYTQDERLLIAAGTYISVLMCGRVLNYAESGNLKLPIMVDSMIPVLESKEEWSAS